MTGVRGLSLAAVSLAVAGAGCASPPAGQNRPFEIPLVTDAAGAREEIPILWQQSGLYSRVNRKLRVVIRDAAGLARLPITEVPVDFSSQMILIACQGPMPGQQVGVRIARVWREGNRLRVQEEIQHAGPPSAGGRVITSPWTVAVIPRSDLNVEGYEPRVPRNVLSDVVGR